MLKHAREHAHVTPNCGMPTFKCFVTRLFAANDRRGVD